MALSRKPLEIVNEGSHQLLVKAPSWERVFLVEIADVQNGAPFDSAFFTHDDGLPLIRIRDIDEISTQNRYNGPYEPDFLVNAGDMLIGMDGDFKVAYWRGSQGLLNQRVCRVIARTALYDQRFLFLCLQPYLNAINAETSSVTVKHLSSRTIGEIPLPLPPLAEQHRIVAKIEELFSELDKGIENLKQARAQLAVYRQALLKHAFEGKLTAGWRAKRLGPDKSSKTPAGWSFRKVSEICNVVRGGSPRPAGDPKFYGGTIPFLKVADLTRREGAYVDSFEFTITEAGLKKTRFVRPPVLLISNSGATLGVPKICMIEATFNDGIAAFLDIPEPHLLYHYYFWESMTRRLRNIDQGAAQPNLNTTILGDVLIPVCSQEEMKKIVETIQAQDAAIASMEADIATNLEKAEALRQSILKKAFSGELVPQDPGDEPASVLLARIRAGRAAAAAPARRKPKTP